MDRRTDSELVEAARSGDKGAFDQLVRRYQPLAQRAAMAMVDHEETARDLAQEAVLQAYLSLRHLNDAGRFRSWLHGIVRNVCRSYLRDRKSDWVSLEALTGGLFPEAVWPSDATRDPHAAVEARERWQAIAEAMQTLSPNDRAVARLFHQEQMTLKEIAATTGFSLPAIKNRLYRARKQLQATLLTAYPDWERSQPGSSERNRMTRVTIDGVVDEERPDGRTASVRLRDEKGRSLRIYMGPGDASAIDLGLRGIALPRPMTFQFMADLLEAIGARLEEVRIDALKEGVFYAKARVRRGKSVRELDARPSDALALAIHAGSPITVSEEIMEQAGRDVPEEAEARPEHAAAAPPIPERLPIMPLRDGVYFPHTVFPIFVGRAKSIRALDEAKAGSCYILLLTQRSSAVDDPQPHDVYQFGTVGQIMNILWLPDNTRRVMIEGKARARVREYIQIDPFHCAQVEILAEADDVEAGGEAMVESVLHRYRAMVEQAKTIGFAPTVPEGLGPGRLADAVAAGIALPVEARQQILETLDARERLEKLSGLLG